MILIAIISSFPINSASISKEMLDNPFPSVENLEAFDFESRQLTYPGIEINLMTTETGDEVYSYFGHTSLEVRIPGYIPLFYDYGYFSFSDGFYLDFVLGRLFYNVYATDGEMRISGFKSANRTVHRTPLDLSPKMKNAILEFLSYNTEPENNTYLYDYYLDNCATRVRDIYNEATGGEFKRWAEGMKTGSTLRKSANLYLDKNPIVSFTLSYLQGPAIDKPITLYEECFLPLSLMKAIEIFEGVESTTVYEAEGRKEFRDLSLNTWCLIFSLSLYFIALFFYSSRKKAVRRIMDIIMSVLYIYFFILSIVLVFVMCFTNHAVTYFNANILYANPLILIMAAEALRGRRCSKRFAYSIISISVIAIAFIMKALFPLVFIQENLGILMVMSSIYLINITYYFLQKEREGNIG